VSKIKSLIDYDVKENIDYSAICVKFAMMSKQIENKDKEIERLNNIINKAIKYIESCTWNNGIDNELQYSLHIPTLLNILKGGIIDE
jgi:hypothetical protein